MAKTWRDVSVRRKYMRSITPPASWAIQAVHAALRHYCVPRKTLCSRERSGSTASHLHHLIHGAEPAKRWSNSEIFHIYNLMKVFTLSSFSSHSQYKNTVSKSIRIAIQLLLLALRNGTPAKQNFLKCYKVLGDSCRLLDNPPTSKSALFIFYEITKLSRISQVWRKENLSPSAPPIKFQQLRNSTSKLPEENTLLLLFHELAGGKTNFGKRTS